MSNKVIKIGSTQNENTDRQNNVYLDVSMDSDSRLSGKYIITKSVDVHAVQNSLNNIFTWIPGERILNPEFGTRLRYYLYEGITKYNEEEIVAEIKQCVAKWEPRVVITDVYNISKVADTEDNTIVLDIKYYIKGLSSVVYDTQYRFNKSE